MPSIVSGPAGSFVLVDGSRCVPATAAGLTVGTAATGAVVGVTLEAAVAIGVAAGATGVAVGAGVNGGRVGGTTTGGAALHVDVMKVSLIKLTRPFRASALPLTVTPLANVMESRARIVPTK